MNRLLLGSTPDGPFRFLLLLLHAGAYGALTWAFGLGCGSLRRGDSATLQVSALRWLRVGFLLLSAGLISHSTWTTFAWGEFWTWDPAKNLGLLVWLAYAGVLHTHHLPGMRGKKTILASLVAWGLLALLLLGVNLRSDRGAVSPTGTASQTQTTSHPGP